MAGHAEKKAAREAAKTATTWSYLLLALNAVWAAAHAYRGTHLTRAALAWFAFTGLVEYVERALLLLLLVLLRVLRPHSHALAAVARSTAATRHYSYSYSYC